MFKNIIFYVPETSKGRDELKEFILKHPELKFVSLVGVDFLGNDTDERIPIEYFLKNMEDIFAGGVQTDGSSVNLPGIATINDAKIDFIIDFERKWFIDHNFDMNAENGMPVGTVRIPIYFRHHNNFYCSRSLLKRTLDHLKKEIISAIKRDDVADIYFTLGTELEFWVRSSVDHVSTHALSVSQMLKESYWKRTNGQIRSCLEECLTMLQSYGLEPEMGHKEVGGVKGKISPDGKLYDVMEQLEIDWRFSDPMQAADNELLARMIIKEMFRRYGLEATFIAKPVEGIAGSGEHMHIGICAILKNGKKINLFAPEEKTSFLSKYGYGALMGLLRHWRAVNPFVTHSISALKRLQPGFEAPVSIVGSLGLSPESPSRNRTVLAGLVRSDNPMSVRFEVRAPNPHTNTYLATAAMYLAMLDGIKYAAGRTEKELSAEINKKYGDKAGYLEQNREYISEKDIFDDYTQEEREKLFGKAPATVWEVIAALKEDVSVFKDTPLNAEIINSFYLSALHKWVIELRDKEISSYKEEMILMERFSSEENEYDAANWKKVEELRTKIAKDDKSNKSIITQLEEAIEKADYDAASSLFLQLREYSKNLKKVYAAYRRNILI